MNEQTLFLDTSRGELRGLAWGAVEAPLVLAIHGGFGVAENFIEIGRRLSDEYRVIALDLPGRGRSFWSEAPETDYRLPVFADLIAEIVDGLAVEQVRWIGTSMGGAVGIHAASNQLKDRITHLVLNDIGPTLPADLTEGIRQGMKAQPVVHSLREMAALLQTSLGALAGVSREDHYWRAKAEHYAKRLPGGGFTMHQDPRIEVHLVEGRGDFEVWEEFRSLFAKTMVIHGWKSPVITAEIVAQMREVKPGLVVADYEEWGHAPFLDRAEDAGCVARFFRS